MGRCAEQISGRRRPVRGRFRGVGALREGLETELGPYTAECNWAFGREEDLGLERNGFGHRR